MTSLRTYPDLPLVLAGAYSLGRGPAAPVKRFVPIALVRAWMAVWVRTWMVASVHAWLVAATLAGACAPESAEREAREHGSPSGYRGTLLPSPLPKPDFTLTDTAGRPFDFRKRTAGQLTLLFFGYTNCPDVCPVHMANLAKVLRDLPWEVRQRVKVVFVTTDPERDTPHRLREWLDRYDSTFIGLTGESERVREIQAALRLPPSKREKGGGGEYAVAHAAQVIAFTPDGSTTLFYPFGTRQTDWAHDLPLLASRWSARQSTPPAEDGG